MRILALIPGGIGDQLLFFPTLEDLKKQYPKATIDVVVEPRAKAAYRVCTQVKEVLTFDYKDRNSLADYLNLLGVLRDREYDVAITLGKRWTVGLLLWLNGIPLRVGYKTKNSWFLSSTVELKTEQYAAHMYHDLLEGLDIKTDCKAIKINVPKQDIDWAQKEQQRLEIKDSGYILLHGGSSALAKSKGINKIYPTAKWEEIIKDIQKKQPQISLVLVLGPEDQQWVKTLSERFANLLVTSPPDIGKLAAMIAGANLMLCTDSAPMHLAVAVGTYTIALFGPTEAKKLLPPNDERFIGIQSPTSEMADIKSETVLQQLWRV